MTVQLLIDAIVRQTTVLIAQLATSGGVRAPLAHVANQVFLDLASELDSQGVSRKVSADMFGMALRAYLRKIRRLSESSTEQGRSLWSAVLDHLRARGVVARQAVFEHFRRDDEALVRSVLNDLTERGLIFRSGSGLGATYRAATDEETLAMRGLGGGADELVWVMIYREGPLAIADLGALTRLDATELEATVSRLSAAGRVHREGGQCSATEFVVPLGQSIGWEAAVLDHYQALVRTIARKLQLESGEEAARTGGSTYTYDVWPGHPMEDEVRRSLADLRHRAGALRQRVEAYNAEHGMPEDHEQVIFYGGQCSLAQSRTSRKEDLES